jgi:4-amino-4-deoxy-L-arabinose transferase-like glycosyltransferase
MRSTQDRDQLPKNGLKIQALWKRIQLSDSQTQVLAIWIGLGIICQFHSPPLTGDFKVYLSTAMEMRELGEWIHPKLYGISSYFKPPFQYWMTLLGWKIFGFGNFGAYFPSVTALALTAYFIGKISGFFRRQSPIDTPITAGLWFAGNIASICYGTVTQMEVWVALFSAICSWLILMSFYYPDGGPRKSGAPNWLALSAFFGIAGMASWVKSPIYSIFIVASLWIFLILTRKLELFRSPRFYLLQGFGVLTGLSWYFWVWMTDRQAFVGHYVNTENLGKLSGNGISAVQVLLDFSLWCTPLLGLLWAGITATLIATATNPLIPRKPSSQRHAQLSPIHLRNVWILAHLAPPFIFFLSFPYRLEAYLYITLPYLVLLLEWNLPKLRSSRWIGALTGVIFGSLFLLVGIVFTLSTLTSRFTGALLSLFSLFFVFIGFLFLILRGKPSHFYGLWKKMAWCSLALAIAVRWGAASLGEIDVAVFRKVIEEHNQRPLAFYDPTHDIWHERGQLGTTIGKPAQSIEKPHAAAEFLKAGGIVVFNDQDQGKTVPEVEKLLKIQKPQNGDQPQKLTEISWLRPRRGFFMPTIDSIKNLASRNQPQWTQTFMKEYKILYLER